MDNASLSPEAIAFAARVYDAARAGQMDMFEQALPAGLPANMTNEKGDSLVSAAGHTLMHTSSFCLVTVGGNTPHCLFSTSHSMNLSIIA